MRIFMVHREEWLAHTLQAEAALHADVQWLGWAARGSLLLPACQNSHPDIVLIGTDVPDFSASDLISVIKQNCAPAKVVVLAETADARLIRSLLSAGASGYLLQSDLPSGLISSLTSVMRSHVVLSSNLLSLIL